MNTVLILICLVAVQSASVFGLLCWIVCMHQEEAFHRCLDAVSKADLCQVQQSTLHTLEKLRLEKVIEALREQHCSFSEDTTAESAVLRALTLMQADHDQFEGARFIVAYGLTKDLYKLDGTEMESKHSIRLLEPHPEYTNLYVSFGNILRPNEDCPICLQPILDKDSAVLHGKCRHSFHPACLEMHHRNAQEWICPFDRAKIIKITPRASGQAELELCNDIVRHTQDLRRALKIGSLNVTSARRHLQALEDALEHHDPVKAAQTPDARATPAQIRLRFPVYQSVARQQAPAANPIPARLQAHAGHPQQSNFQQPEDPRYVAPHQRRAQPAIPGPALALALPATRLLAPLQPLALGPAPAGSAAENARSMQRQQDGVVARAVRTIDGTHQYHAVNRPQPNQQQGARQARPAWR